MLKKSLTALMLLLTFEVKAECFNKVGKIYRLDPDYLRAIAYKESKFNTTAIGKNNDGSRDIGIMQINTSNISWLRKKFPQISISNLLKYPCFNIHVGGYILNENFKMYGRKWIAVGAYNAGGKNNPKRIKIRYKYAKEISENYKAIKAGRLRLPSVHI